MAGKMNRGIILARIKQGRELLKAQEDHRATEKDWILYLGTKNLSRPQAQDVMRLAKRFDNSDMLPSLLELEPSSKILMKLCSRDVSEEEVRTFFAKVTHYISDMQCEIALAEIQNVNKSSPLPTLNGFNKAQENKVKTPEIKNKEQKQQPNEDQVIQELIEDLSSIRGDNVEMRDQVKNLAKDPLFRTYAAKVRSIAKDSRDLRASMQKKS